MNLSLKHRYYQNLAANYTENNISKLHTNITEIPVNIK